jgi:hypothetical protein
LYVGEANKAVIAKQWQWNTSICFHPSEKMSDRLMEQYINIMFCVKLGKSASKSLKMLTEAYGADAMKKSSVFEWQKRESGRRERRQKNRKSEISPYK